MTKTAAFATPLKRMLFAMGWEREYLYGDSKEVPHPFFGVSGREAMQTLGTLWGRGCVSNDVWVRLCAQEITSKIEEGADNIIITDVRFNDEAMLVKSLGGVVFRVLRDTQDVGLSGHPSEAGVSDVFIDSDIFNYTSIDDLKGTASYIVDNDYAPEAGNVGVDLVRSWLQNPNIPLSVYTAAEYGPDHAGFNLTHFKVIKPPQTLARGIYKSVDPSRDTIANIQA